MFLNFKNIIDNQKNIQKETFEKSIRLTTENRNLKHECEELKYENTHYNERSDKLWKINYITGIALIYCIIKIML